MKFLNKNLILVILAVFSIYGINYANSAVITPKFPATLNYFQEGDVIEDEDWNAIEIRIGETGTTTKSTITYQLDQLMSTTTLSNLANIGTITTGIWNGTTIGEVYGGTNQTTYATGDILYASGANTLSKLGIGTAGQVLKISGGIPAWGTDSTGAGDPFAWTPSTTYNTSANSTSTPIWLKNTLYASSTSFFTGSANFDNNINLTNGGFIYGDTTDEHIELNSLTGSQIGFGSGANHTHITLTGGVIQMVTNNSEAGRWSSGNLGINNTSPTYRLTVGGEAQFSSYVDANYFTATSTNTNTLPYTDITRLVNLTSNGFVKTSGGTGALSIDTSTYLTGNETITLSGDVSGSGATAITTTIGADKVLESMLKSVNAPTDEYCLTYEATIGDFEWQTCVGAGVWTDQGTYLDPTNGEGIIVSASSTIANLSITTATTTQLTVNNTFAVGTNGTEFTVNSSGVVGAGTWNGTALLDTYVDDGITLTNITQITNRAITDLTGTLTVGNGGTGATTLTDGGVLFGSGTGAITASSVLTNGQLLIGDGTTDPTLATLTGGTNLTVSNGAGSITLNVDDAFLSNAGDTGTGNYDFSGATLKQKVYPAFTYATSTAWTGTTTIPIGVAYNAELWNGVKCFTDVGTLNVAFNDGTNYMNDFNASTTVGTVTLSTNNTFTASEKRYVDIGSPVTSPTKISCTVDKTVNN